MNFEYVSKSIQPEDYNYIGSVIVFSFEVEGGRESEAEVELNLEDLIGVAPEDLERVGEQLREHGYSAAYGRTQCNCCNHSIKRGCFFQNNKTLEMIFVGFDCANNIMKFRFDIEGAKKQTMAARKQREKIMKINSILEANPGLDSLLEVNDKTIRSIAEKFRQYASLSEKQISFIKSLAERRLKFESSSKEAVEGKFEGELTILSAKWYTAEAYGVSKIGLKVLLQHADGWKSYGNLSFDGQVMKSGDVIFTTKFAELFSLAPLCDEKFYNVLSFPYYIDGNLFLSSLKGKVLNCKCTINKSTSDSFFSFFKRLTIKKVK